MVQVTPRTLHLQKSHVFEKKERDIIVTMPSCKERQAKRRADIKKDKGETEGRPICAVSLCVGQWVVVDYDGENFPGACCNGDDQFEVSVMHKSGNHWKWPKVVDKILYARDDIVRTTCPPRGAGAPWTVPF